MTGPPSLAPVCARARERFQVKVYVNVRVCVRESVTLGTECAKKQKEDTCHVETDPAAI